MFGGSRPPHAARLGRARTPGPPTLGLCSTLAPGLCGAPLFALLVVNALWSAPMPSFLHEGLIDMIRKKPEFAADLLREILHVEVPSFTEARLSDANFPQVIPIEFRADAVVLLVDDEPVFGCIFEAQLGEDREKRFSWPVYAVTARARFECPFVVVVATPDSAIARWAARPIDLGAGQFWAPLVVGPEGIPVIIDAQKAQQVPELAVLSVMAHGKGDPQTAVDIALAASAALTHLTEEQRMLYLLLIETALGDAAKEAFEMHPQTEKLMSSWQRGSFEKGRAEGQAEGLAHSKAADVLDVLDARGLPVTPEQRERILGCSDLELLKTWLRRAATAAAIDALFSA